MMLRNLQTCKAKPIYQAIDKIRHVPLRKFCADDSTDDKHKGNKVIARFDSSRAISEFTVHCCQNDLRRNRTGRNASNSLRKKSACARARCAKEFDGAKSTARRAAANARPSESG